MARARIALLMLALAAGIIAAGAEGLHDQRLCRTTANPSLCALAFDAGETEREAIRAGNS